MGGLQQDLIGNAVMFAALYISARKTPRRKLFWLFLLLGFALFSGIRYLYFTHLSPLIPRDVRQTFNMIAFTAFIPLTAAVSLLCWEMDFWAALYCGSSAYCIQHILNKCYDIVRHLWLDQADEPIVYLVYIGLALALLLLYRQIVIHQRVYSVRIDKKALLLLSMLVVVCAIVLDIRSRPAIHDAQQEAYYIVRLYSIIAASLILSIQLTLVSSKNKELENNTLHTLLEEQQEQYRFEKSIIDSLNIKVHDIKHQLEELDDASRQKLTEELSPALEAYNGRFHTENPALDVILSRKSFVCHERHIHLTAMADGASLNFMREADVYSLFGNILDNAIEAAGKLEDSEQKVIKLSVEKRGYFVSIHVENYFSDKLEFEDGLPKTTKPDTVYHGFGMKSIRMLAGQYDGNVKIATEGNRFILDILFPV